MDPSRNLKSREFQEVRISMRPSKYYHTLQPGQSFGEKIYWCRNCGNMVTLGVAGPAKHAKSGMWHRWKCPYCGKKMNILLPLKAKSFVIVHHHPPPDFVLNRLLKLKIKPGSNKLTRINFQQAGKLLKFLSNEDPWIRRESARLLGLLKLELASSGLTKLLNDPYRKIQAVAANALANMGDKSVLPKLLQMLESGDPEVLFDSVRALEKIGDESCIQPMVKAERREGIMMSNFIRGAMRKIRKRLWRQRIEFCPR